MKELEVINRCLTRTGIEKSSLRGEFIFALLVGNDGRVKDGRIERKPAATDELSRCILETLKTLRFQADSGRQEVSLKITFTIG
jgi:hypothetical protein